jgi:hypothetical protein
MMRYTWVLVHRCAGLEIALFSVPPEGCGSFSKRLIVGNFGCRWPIRSSGDSLGQWGTLYQ